MADDDLVSNGQFSIRVRKGEWEVEVSAPDKNFVLNETDRLIERIGNGNMACQLPKNAILEGEVIHLNESNLPKASKPQTLNKFYRQFKLQTNLEKILALEHWCTGSKGQRHCNSE